MFRRVDRAGGGIDIQATWRNVVDTRLCTRIGLAGGPSVGTIEHLMAALAGSDIDNALIEIEGAEVPIMDGSSAPFMFLIECAGVVEQQTPRRALKVVVSADGVMNEGGLRYDDEFVRHKMLDAVGDLYLAGGPLLGRFHGHRSGHHLHHAALVQLFADPTAWRWAELPAAVTAADGRLAATA